MKLLQRIYPIYLCASLLLVACRPGVPASPPLAGVPLAGTASQPATTEDVRDPVTVVVGMDVSSNYPADYFEQMKETIATSIDRLVRSDQRRFDFFFQAIRENSYEPAAELEPPITVLPIGPEPAPPAPPAAACGDFGRANCVQRQKAAYAQAFAEYERSRAAHSEKLDALKARVHGQTDRLRALQPERDSDGADLTGLLIRAQDRFRVPGQHYLLIVSGLEQQGPQSEGEWRLPGVYLAVGPFYCREAGPCEARKADWSRRFQDQGAARVEFFERGDVDLVDNLFDE